MEELLENMLQKDVKQKLKNKTPDEEKQILPGQDVEKGRASSLSRGWCSRAGMILLSYTNYFTTIVFMMIFSVTTVFIEQTSWTLVVSVIEFIAVAVLDSYLGNSRLRLRS